MKQFLSSTTLNEIRRDINQTLTDTFQMMFHLEVFLLPQGHAPADDRMVCSHMDLMEKNATTGTLSISMTQDLAHYITTQLDPLATEPSPAQLQDIVNEIDNIIANHLRSYIFTHVGVDLEMSLPKPGMPANPTTKAQTINLHFRIRKEDSVNLSFSYGS